MAEKVRQRWKSQDNMKRPDRKRPKTESSCCWTDVPHFLYVPCCWCLKASRWRSVSRRWFDTHQTNTESCVWVSVWERGRWIWIIRIIIGIVWLKLWLVCVISFIFPSNERSGVNSSIFPTLHISVEENTKVTNNVCQWLNTVTMSASHSRLSLCHSFTTSKHTLLQFMIVCEKSLSDCAGFERDNCLMVNQ